MWLFSDIQISVLTMDAWSGLGYPIQLTWMLPRVSAGLKGLAGPTGPSVGVCELPAHA